MAKAAVKFLGEENISSIKSCTEVYSQVVKVQDECVNNLFTLEVLIVAIKSDYQTKLEAITNG